MITTNNNNDNNDNNNNNLIIIIIMLKHIILYRIAASVQVLSTCINSIIFCISQFQ